ncbi:MAG: hypothetical protein AABN95_08010 [Acidobacteriota bacterium]
MKQDYEDHPLSSVLPMMGQMEIREMAADMQANGLRSEIVLLDGKILDGRNRYRACKIGGITPRFRDFNGEGDPLSFIVSANVKRRHLTTSQRALVAAKIANLPSGITKTRSAILPTLPKTETDAAEELSVSPRSVRTAKEVLRNAPKQEVEKVERGEKTVTTVARETKAAKAKIEEKEKHFDKTGYPIPESVLGDWDRASELGRKWLRAISDLRSEIKTVFKDESVLLVEIDNTTLADLNNAYSSIKLVEPYAICGTCQGVQKKKCNLCKGRGFLSSFAWDKYVPEETKKMRGKIK